MPNVLKATLPLSQTQWMAEGTRPFHAYPCVQLTCSRDCVLDPCQDLGCQQRLEHEGPPELLVLRHVARAVHEVLELGVRHLQTRAFLIKYRFTLSAFVLSIKAVPLPCICPGRTTIPSQGETGPPHPVTKHMRSRRSFIGDKQQPYELQYEGQQTTRSSGSSYHSPRG